LLESKDRKKPRVIGNSNCAHNCERNGRLVSLGGEEDDEIAVLVGRRRRACLYLQSSEREGSRFGTVELGAWRDVESRRREEAVEV
jgi:hypothetical protein